MDEQKALRSKVILRGLAAGIVLSLSCPLSLYFNMLTLGRETSRLTDISVFYALPIVIVLLCRRILFRHGMEKWGWGLCLCIVLAFLLDFAFAVWVSRHLKEQLFFLIFLYIVYVFPEVVCLSIITDLTYQLKG